MIMIYIDLIMKVIFLDIDGVLNTSGDENLIEYRLFSLFGIGENDSYVIDNDLNRLLDN